MKSTSTSLFTIILYLIQLHTHAQTDSIFLVKDLNSGSSNGFDVNSSQQYQVINDTLYFFGKDSRTVSTNQVCISDGTAAGTRMLKNDSAITTRVQPKWESSTIEYQNRFLFMGENMGSAIGSELYGCTNKDSSFDLYHNFGQGTNVSGVPQTMITIGKYLLVNGQETSNGVSDRIHAFDGNQLDTVFQDYRVLQKDPVIFKGMACFAGFRVYATGQPDLGIVGVDSNLNVHFFEMNDYGRLPYNVVRDLHVADTILYCYGELQTSGWDIFALTESGTTVNLVKDLGQSSFSSRCNPIGTIDHKLIFSSSNATSSQPQLYVTDGTDTGTHLIRDFGSNGMTIYGPSAKLNGEVFMILKEDSFGVELWKTDGTAAGTKVVKDRIEKFSSWKNYQDLSELFTFGNKIYFNGETYDEGKELWETDGTAAGTKMVQNYVTGRGSLDPKVFINLKNELYFSGLTNATGRELFKLQKGESNLINLGNDTAVCDAFELKVNQNYTSYEWSTGDTSQSLAVDTTGTYWLKVTDANGNFDRDTIIVTVNAQPTFDSLDSYYKNCGSLLLHENPNMTQYLWGNGDTTASTTFEESFIGNILTITNSFGCVDSLTGSIIIDTIPTLSIPSRDSSCTDLIVFVPKNSGLQYAWENGDSTNSTRRFKSDTAILTVSDNNGCMAKDSTIITIFNRPEISITIDTSGCDSVLLQDINPNNTYVWNRTDTTYSYIAKVKGRQSYEVKAISPEGCIALQQVYVNILSSPKLDYFRDTFGCTSITLSGKDMSNTFVWNEKDTGSTYTSYQTGTNELKIEAISEDGCSADTTINLNIEKRPEILLPIDTTLCDSLTFNLSADSNTYIWQNMDTTQIYTINQSGYNSYEVKAISPNGCVGISQIYVGINSSPSGDSIAALASTNSHAFVAYGLSDQDSLSWHFGDGNTSLTETPTHSYDSNGTYEVMLVLYNECGTDTLFTSVTIDYNQTSNISISLPKGAIKLYPNPATDVIKLETNYDVETVKIYSNNGRQVLNKKSKYVDISFLESGLYLVTVQTKDGQWVSRFIKQ